MALILIVDDSSTEIHRLTSILKKNGHTVLTTENGADAIDICRKEKPNAVLMDIVMPGLNGFQATRQLAKDPITEHIPVIIITSKDQDTDKTWGLRQGALDYLTKPVKEKTLLNAIDHLVSTAKKEKNINFA